MAPLLYDMLVGPGANLLRTAVLGVLGYGVLVLFYRGQTMRDVLRRERLTMDEVLAAARTHGVNRLEDIEAVVLESDGSLSVLRRDAERGASALGNVSMPDAACSGAHVR